MCSPGINGEGELMGQPANPGSPGKMAVKTECVCVCAFNNFSIFQLNTITLIIIIIIIEFL